MTLSKSKSLQSWPLTALVSRSWNKYNPLSGSAFVHCHPQTCWPLTVYQGLCYIIMNTSKKRFCSAGVQAPSPVECVAHSTCSQIRFLMPPEDLEKKSLWWSEVMRCIESSKCGQHKNINRNIPRKHLRVLDFHNHLNKCLWVPLYADTWNKTPSLSLECTNCNSVTQLCQKWWISNRALENYKPKQLLL